MINNINPKDNERIKLGYMEFFSSIKNGRYDFPQDILYKAAEDSQIHTFGWPIGVILGNREEFRPKYYNDRIEAIIDIKEENRMNYDFWYLKRNGEYYYIGDLFEDDRKQNKLFLDTRIIRTTETFLHISSLYKLLKIEDKDIIDMTIKYGGLKERILTAANPLRAFTFAYDRKCLENETRDIVFSLPLSEIETNLNDLVFDVIKEISMLFDGFVPSKTDVVIPIIDNFKVGKIS